MSVQSLVHSVARALEVKLLGIGGHVVPAPRRQRPGAPDPTPESVLAFLERQLEGRSGSRPA